MAAEVDVMAKIDRMIPTCHCGCVLVPARGTLMSPEGWLSASSDGSVERAGWNYPKVHCCPMCETDWILDGWFRGIMVELGTDRMSRAQGGLRQWF